MTTRVSSRSAVRGGAQAPARCCARRTAVRPGCSRGCPRPARSPSAPRPRAGPTSAETGELYATGNGGRGWRVVRLPRPTAYRGSAALPGLPTFTDERTGVLPVTLAGARSAVSFLRSQDAGRTWRRPRPWRRAGRSRRRDSCLRPSSTRRPGSRRSRVDAASWWSHAAARAASGGAAIAPVRRLQAAGRGDALRVRVSGLGADRDPVPALP